MRRPISILALLAILGCIAPARPFTSDFYDFAGAWMAKLKIECGLVPGLNSSRLGAEVYLVIANIEGSGMYQIHAAARALSGHFRCVIGMHGADPGGLVIG